MKKLVLTALATIAIPALVLAQGTVTFGSGGVNVNNQYVQYDNLVKAGGATVSLWWSPDNIAPFALVATKLTEASAPFTGYMFNNVSTETVSGGAPGATVWFYLTATAPGGWFGQTPHFTVGPLGGGEPPQPAPTLDGWTAPITMVIPEPSTIALAGLGVASLLLFRRRK